jgi:hypothetical protein
VAVVVALRYSLASLHCACPSRITGPQSPLPASCDRGPGASERWHYVSSVLPDLNRPTVQQQMRRSTTAWIDLVPLNIE